MIIFQTGGPKWSTRGTNQTRGDIARKAQGEIRRRQALHNRRTTLDKPGQLVRETQRQREN